MAYLFPARGEAVGALKVAVSKHFSSFEHQIIIAAKSAIGAGLYIWCVVK